MTNATRGLKLKTIQIETSTNNVIIKRKRKHGEQDAFLIRDCVHLRLSPKRFDVFPNEINFQFSYFFFLLKIERGV